MVIGKLERATQNRIITLFREELGYRYLGDWTVYRVKLATGEILRVTRANASRFVENPIDWDEQVYVTFAPDAAVILAE